jgi:hypothetical protein
MEPQSTRRPAVEDSDDNDPVPHSVAVSNEDGDEEDREPNEESPEDELSRLFY